MVIEDTQTSVMTSNYDGHGRDHTSMVFLSSRRRQRSKPIFTSPTLLSYTYYHYYLLSTNLEK